MDDDRKVRIASCAVTTDLLEEIDQIVEQERRARREFVSRSTVMRDLLRAALHYTRRRAA
jgi:metal-responsive CopG/Arc/MetJ family transcriptional regulator